jgi:hypothetical protein
LTGISTCGNLRPLVDRPALDPEVLMPQLLPVAAVSLSLFVPSAPVRGPDLRLLERWATVYLTEAPGLPSVLTSVRLQRTFRVGRKTLLQFRQETCNGIMAPSGHGPTWLIDAARVVFVVPDPVYSTGVGIPPGQFGDVPP